MRGERIEWEAIARRKHQIARVTRGGLASTAEERELEYIDALEAGEAMAAAQEAIAAHWSACEACQDEGCCEEIAMSDLWKHRDDALAAWRRCVAPRGEGA